MMTAVKEVIAQARNFRKISHAAQIPRFVSCFQIHVDAAYRSQEKL